MVRRRAGHDAVVVGGETLCFHDSLSTAVGTGAEIRMVWWFAVERLDHRLRHVRHLVDCAIIEIGLLLGMTDRPSRVARAAFVPGVGRRTGVSAVEGFAEAEVAERSSVSAIPDAKVAAVPAGDGQPHFHADARVARWCDDRLDATEHGEPSEVAEHFHRGTWAAPGRQVKGARRDELCIGDRGVGESQFRQTVAGSSVCRCGSDREDERQRYERQQRQPFVGHAQKYVVAPAYSDSRHFRRRGNGRIDSSGGLRSVARK